MGKISLKASGTYGEVLNKMNPKKHGLQEVQYYYRRGNKFFFRSTVIPKDGFHVIVSNTVREEMKKELVFKSRYHISI